ncbi:catechol 2,3-dioxygenase-like lactoylglutathione lyase family enzyme [Microbacterium natoriense]|uniref:Bleomycin resistance protein n=1 Tax=Microbacterium natoriense TaxID=284570 RepID=A0AAW8EXM3_9MICO|nr:bleomycin resistance protein [Microbacterium natoriense]MDQ0648078.1 catechol 2,3-dioxygenase-like lactoylglutathione lyase family enzyme [Microbacterium natoriense]
MSGDRAVPNLPSRDLLATSAFYARFGFIESFRDEGWMILRRGSVELEFFPVSGLDPWTSSFRCSIRVADLDELWRDTIAAGIPIGKTGFPRLHEPRVERSGLRIAYLVDPDGNQLALIAEPHTRAPCAR